MLMGVKGINCGILKGDKIKTHQFKINSNKRILLNFKITVRIGFIKSQYMYYS